MKNSQLDENLDLLTKRGIADALGYSSMRSVEKILREIPHLRVRGKVLVRRRDFESWLRQFEVTPEAKKEIRTGLARLVEDAKKKVLAEESRISIREAREAQQKHMD
jgi:hypothetical protein